VERLDGDRHTRTFTLVRSDRGVLFEAYYARDIERVRQRYHLEHGVPMVPVDYFDILVGRKEGSVDRALETYLADHAVLWLPLTGTDQELIGSRWINPATLETVG
jgi:hypothetical protein